MGFRDAQVNPKDALIPIYGFRAIAQSAAPSKFIKKCSAYVERTISTAICARVLLTKSLRRSAVVSCRPLRSLVFLSLKVGQPNIGIWVNFGLAATMMATTRWSLFNQARRGTPNKTSGRRNWRQEHEC